MSRKIPKNGIIKCKTDKLGRLLIPAPYRRKLGIEPKEELSMVLTGEGMYVFKETEEEILKRKCNEVMSAASTCKDMNVEEREKLGELLVKLIGESAEC